jgi:hypothetical protein
LPEDSQKLLTGHLTGILLRKLASAPTRLTADDGELMDHQAFHPGVTKID